MDHDRISLANYINLPGFSKTELNFQIEEALEMTGAFEMVLASLFLFFGSRRPATKVERG
jgi:hypothetical protein